MSACEMDPWRACTTHRVGYLADGTCPLATTK